MPNVTTLAKQNEVASAPRLPGWLHDLVDYAHPNLGWRPPARLPTPADLRNAIAGCERLLSARATPAFAKQCIAKLMVAFEPNTKLTADETRLRATIWLEANGDLCDGLWAEATAAAIRGLKWMPKPSEFRELVEPRLDGARRHLPRLKEMLEAHSKPAAPFVPEPWDVRIRGLRDSWRKVGNVGRAAQYERQLAEHEKREPEQWAKEVA